jgi:hypothetical protein
MKNTIIISALVALLVNVLCAYPMFLFIVGWLALGYFTNYLWNTFGGGCPDDHLIKFTQFLLCYAFPIITIPVVLILEQHRIYYEFPNLPRFRSPIYFQDKE